MDFIMRRCLVFMVLATAVLSAGPLVSPVEACPMCKNANESDDNRPRAYMFSILFMLAMPATVFTGFGVGFYRLSRRQNLPVDDETQLPEADRIPGSSKND